jgi:hypothetical protein
MPRGPVAGLLLQCRILLGLVSGLLPGGGFGSRALLGLLGRGSPLPGGGFDGRALLGLLGRGSTLPSGGFDGRAPLGLLGRGSLLPGGGFGGALLRLLARAGQNRELYAARRC